MKRIYPWIVPWMLIGAVGLTAEPERDFVEPPIVESDRQHWAFEPISRPDLPSVQRTSWPMTGVDFFILSELEANNLGPARQADKATLLRRLKFDLHGLPPSAEELSQFENDLAADAYERLVDRLLSSPAYGERWAQYWLDLARYAETDGFEHDKVRRQAWKYRDWVIHALNVDLAYDRFVHQQLVGSEGKDPKAEIATMFCLAGPDMPDINEQDLRRHDKLNEITSTVGAVFLGLQLHCAQCHDHKYDPLSQADFYRLRAVFEPSIPQMKRDQPVHFLVRQSSSAPARFYHRGELKQPGAVVLPGVPRVAVPAGQSFECDPQSPRLGLVDWLFSDSNPLTARVIANRLWQYHFGRSLCENPSDFGVVAGGPTHPQLLDWLATELRRERWSLKRLHRTILLSATYRQASRGDGDGDIQWTQRVQRDATNELYSRFPRQRLQGEVLRDALLAVSGQLNRQIGGESVRPPLPQELLETLLKGQWTSNDNPADQSRRSIYVFARRNLRYPIFDAFDRPDGGASCARRDRSTTAIQSLQMLNSDLSLSAAKGLRDRLLASLETESPLQIQRLVESLFVRALARRPSGAEQTRFGDLLTAENDMLEENLLTACLALLNTNEFLYID